MDHRLELRTVVELARFGNARRAADSLGLSQSTVSEVLTRLERSYGTKLFDRGRHGSRTTATGALVVEAARRSLEILDNAEREVGLLEGFERGSLSIAAHPCLVETHLAPAVAAVLRGTLNLHCQMHTAPPDTLLESLRRQQLEFFIGLEPDGPCDDVASEPIGTFRPVPFSRPGHPLANTPPEGVKVLRVYPIIATEVPRWYEHRTDTMATADPALADEIAQRGRRVNVGHLATMEALVTTTDSLGFAPRDAIQTGIDDGKFVIIEVPPDEQVLLLDVPIVLVTLKDRPLPPSANAVIDELRSRHRFTMSP
jgi:DNA-binding transcriptional LysR family regulator